MTFDLSEKIPYKYIYKAIFNNKCIYYITSNLSKHDLLVFLKLSGNMIAEVNLLNVPKINDGRISSIVEHIYIDLNLVVKLINCCNRTILNELFDNINIKRFLRFHDSSHSYTQFCKIFYSGQTLEDIKEKLKIEKEKAIIREIIE